MTFKTRSVLCKTLLCVLILAQVMLVPRGWMPAGNILSSKKTSQKVEIVICTSYGPSKIFVDASIWGQKPAKPHPSKHKKSCPYAAVASVDALPPLYIASKEIIVNFVPHSLATYHVAKTVGNKSWRSRAPPFLSV